MKPTGRSVPAVGVYAEQLICKGYGLPLWQPEPPDSGAVRIGDVGLVDNGRFVRLFNAMQNAEHPLNRWGVPEGFVPLRVHPEVLRTSPAFLQPGPVFNSQSVSCDVSAGVSVAVPGVGAKYNFSCSSDRAAVAMLGGPGVQHKALANLPFREYMARHHQSWVNFATSVFGLVVAPEEIILVSSTVTTCQWALAVCTANALSLDLSFEVPIANIASVSFGLATFRSSPMAIDQRSGPHRQGDDVTSSSHPPLNNQCMFLAYYKCRRRMWSQKPRFTTAVNAKDAQGPAEGEWPSSSSSSSKRVGWKKLFRNPFKRSLPSNTRTSTKDVTEFPPLEETFQDPLDAILDYILANSDCALAVTSHEDLYALFRDEAQWPSDFRGALDSAKPGVCIDKDQVGTLLLEHDVANAFSARRAGPTNNPWESVGPLIPSRGALPTHPVASGSRTQQSPSSHRKIITRALEFAREAVRIDASNEDPQGAVSTYEQSIMLLNSVLEQLTQAGRLTLEASTSAASQSVRKDQEVSNLRRIRDTYAERVNILCTLYSIRMPNDLQALAGTSSPVWGAASRSPDPATSSPAIRHIMEQAPESFEAVPGHTLMTKPGVDALPSIHDPSEESRTGVDAQRDDPPQHEDNAQSNDEYPPLKDILLGKGSNTPPRSPRASTHEKEDLRPPSPHLSPRHSDKLSPPRIVDILSRFPTIPTAQLRSISGSVETLTLYAHRWSRGTDTRADG